MNKEEVYDEEIGPLMQNIIKICKDNGIAVVVNFAIPTDEDEDLQVLTNLPDENGKVPESHAAAVRAIRPSSSAPMITVTHADGSKEITAII